MNTALHQRSCQACATATEPLKGQALIPLAEGINDDWQIVGDHHLARSWRFADFRNALAFTNAVGELAESEGHHPDIKLGYGWVDVVIYTHKVDGLTEADFILAAKIDHIDTASLGQTDSGKPVEVHTRNK